MGFLIAFGMSTMGLYLLHAERRGQELLHPKAASVVGAVLLPLPLEGSASVALVVLVVADREVQVLVVDRGLHAAWVTRSPELEALGLPAAPASALEVLALPGEARGQMVGLVDGSVRAVATFGPEGRTASASLELGHEPWQALFDQALTFLREGGEVSAVALSDLPELEAPVTLEGLARGLRQAWAGSWGSVG